MTSSNTPVRIRANVHKLNFSPTLALNEQVSNARSDGVNILHMGFGQSPFPVHPEIRSALAANADKNMYLPSSGLPELRSLAGAYFAEEFGFNANDFDVIIGPGSKELIFDIQLAVEGDLQLPVPSWVSYAPQSILTHDQIIRIDTSITEGHHITPKNLETAILNAQKDGRNPKKLIINYPNNPSGLTIPPGRLEQISQVCRKYGILVVSDEIYGLVNYQNDHTSIARFYPEGTIITTGLSKHLSLGGYRLGVAMVPKRLRPVFDAVNRIVSETWSCVPAPIQYAALKAFERNPNVEEYIQTCTRIHQLVSGYVREAIVALGIIYPVLQGAFYIYPDFDRYRDALLDRGIETSDHLAKDLLNTVQFATLPGTAFGDPADHLRLRLAMCDFDGQSALNYYHDNPGCTSDEIVKSCCPNIVLACERLVGYFGNITNP